MDLLGLGSKGHIDFILDPQGQRKQIEVKLDDNNNKRSLQYIYYDGEDVGGSVQIRLKKRSKVEHQGIRLEFIGKIEMLNDRSTIHEFINLSKLLALPGELTENTSIDFHFPNVEKPYESYIGKNESLLKEIENHEQRLLKQLNNECVRITQEYPSHQEEFQQRLQQLTNN
ncbi:unnamed protein product [Rotaria socialis]|uniref:Uncharacterized protein n=1 Tax=Rotaria socialis TaxID=392032 RepID=A0A817ULR9_9BILA|nr:unnamed protein product [Rotaria socialis]